MIQALVDNAAHFNLFSRSESGVAIRHANHIIGFDIRESLYRFDVRTFRSSSGKALQASNTIGERIGSFHHRWMLAPDNYVASPNHVPPPTPLDPTRSQRFVMLDGVCQLGGGSDGFRGFGAGRTLPTSNGSRVMALANATILQGLGKFAGHEQGTYVYSGSLDPNHGFQGNLMLRTMNVQQAFRSQTALPKIQSTLNREPGVTYLVLRGEAELSDPVRPYIGPDGNQLGLIVEQGLRLQHVDCAAKNPFGLQVFERIGEKVGRVTAYVVFDPDSAAGTSLDPLNFTAYDEFVFFDGNGNNQDGFVADSSEGRVFHTKLSEHPAIRFGGVGQIRNGTGRFRNISGVMTDNSVVVFSPHVSASIYVLRIEDPESEYRKESIHD